MKFKKIILLFILFIPFWVNASSEVTAVKRPFGNKIYGQSNHDLYLVNLSGDVYEYDIVSNSYKLIVTPERYTFTAYVDGDYLYLWHDTYYWDYSFSNPPRDEFYDGITEISCYNLKTKELQFRYRISVGEPSSGEGRFIATKKQEIILMGQDGYETESGNTVRYVHQYDKNGNEIGLSHYLQLSGDYATNFDAITPNGEFMVLTSGYTGKAYHYLENGLITGHTFEINNRQKGYNWYFISDDVAINNNGSIARFYVSTLTDPSNKVRKVLSYEPLINSYSGNYHYAPTYFIEGNSIYLPDGKGNIIIYDKNTYRKTGIIKIEDSSTIEKIYKDDKYFYVVYTSQDSDTEFLKKLTLNEAKASKNIEITTHTALTHSLTELKTQYKESQPKFDYSKSIFKVEPKTTAPYYEGVLNNQVINDTLNQLNYYRWMTGLKPLEINANKMSRNQKGALLLSVNKTLTHSPKQPADMDTEFYTEAKHGVGARTYPGDTYEGNIALSSKIYYAPILYIDDSDNVIKDVGHRASMLNPYAYQVSFGQSGIYNSTSIYTDNELRNKDEFYSYPNPGYFDIYAISSNALWSIWISPYYEFLETTTIELTYNGHTYIIPNNKIGYDLDGTMYYEVPSELKKIISENSIYKKNITIEVKVKDLEKRNSADYYSIKYQTTFIDPEEEITYLKGDLNLNEKIDLTDVLIILKIHFKTITPNAVEKEVGDMNSDSKIDLTDVLLLLKEYFKKN